MMCYNDMTFCRGDGCANFGPCFRSLTDEVAAKAERCGLPISQFINPKEAECYIPHPIKPKSE